MIGKQIPEAPHEVLLVLDATTGQNGISQAKHFTEAVHCTGIVLAKLDGTAKGGVVVAIRQQVGLPVKYVGVGEKAEDLALFEPDDFVDALFADLVSPAQPKRAERPACFTGRLIAAACRRAIAVSAGNVALAASSRGRPIFSASRCRSTFRIPSSFAWLARLPTRAMHADMPCFLGQFDLAVAADSNSAEPNAETGGHCPRMRSARVEPAHLSVPRSTLQPPVSKDWRTDMKLSKLALAGAIAGLLSAGAGSTPRATASTGCNRRSRPPSNTTATTPRTTTNKPVRKTRSRGRSRPASCRRCRPAEQAPAIRQWRRHDAEPLLQPGRTMEAVR